MKMNDTNQYCVKTGCKFCLTFLFWWCFCWMLWLSLNVECNHHVLPADDLLWKNRLCKYLSLHQFFHQFSYSPDRQMFFQPD